MKAILLFIFIVLLSIKTGLSQDAIYRTNGEIVYCKIQKVDSVHIFFSITKNQRKIATMLRLYEVERVEYNVPEISDSVIDSVSMQIDRRVGSFGLGLDYGGLGTHATLYPQKNIGVFGGFGYALADFTFCAGIKIRKISKIRTSKIVPYISGMYGYNTVIVNANSITDGKVFYGFSVGVGMDIRPKPVHKGYWSVKVWIPIRDKEVKEYMQYLVDKRSASFQNDLLPFAISIGYNIIFD